MLGFNPKKSQSLYLFFSKNRKNIRGELQGSEADVVQSFVVNAEGLVRVLDQLVDREGGVVWLNNGVRNLSLKRSAFVYCESNKRKEYLWRWHNGECAHHTVRVFFTDLGDQKCTHTGTGTTTERVGDLETLQAVARFGFLADNVQDGVDEFSTCTPSISIYSKL